MISGNLVSHSVPLSHSPVKQKELGLITCTRPPSLGRDGAFGRNARLRWGAERSARAEAGPGRAVSAGPAGGHSSERRLQGTQQGRGQSTLVTKNKHLIPTEVARGDIRDLERQVEELAL